MTSQRQIDRNSLVELETEKEILGSILYNFSNFMKVSDTLSHEYFYHPLHQRIYYSIKQHFLTYKMAVGVEVLDSVIKDVEEEDIDNGNLRDYLRDLVALSTLLEPRFDECVKLLQERYLRRKLIDALEDTARELLDVQSFKDIDTIIRELEKVLYSISDSDFAIEDYDFGKQLKETVELLESAYKHRGEIFGLKTGISKLDEALKGLKNSNLIVLAGRPAMGKTALATNIAYNIAKNCQTDSDGIKHSTGRVAFFSLEMSSVELIKRIFSSELDIRASKLQSEMLTEEELFNTFYFAKDNATTSFHLIDKSNISVDKLCSMARRLKRNKKIDCIVIDYLQLLQLEDKYLAKNRTEAIAYITRKLKVLARELNIPIIALSQLSRQVEQRENKRPQLSDLRESGSIEQDADIVLFVYREAYYLEQQKPDMYSKEYPDWEKKLQKVKNKAEVIISKFRNGKPGIVEVTFLPDFSSFK